MEGYDLSFSGRCDFFFSVLRKKGQNIKKYLKEKNKLYFIPLYFFSPPVFPLSTIPSSVFLSLILSIQEI